MEGLLARWALAIQEYDFTITYHKGQNNGNADALSRKAHTAATTQLHLLTEELRQQQFNHPIVQQIYEALSQKQSAPPHNSVWHTHPYSQYKQLWSQLCLHDRLQGRTREVSRGFKKPLWILHTT